MPQEEEEGVTLAYTTTSTLEVHNWVHPSSKVERDPTCLRNSEGRLMNDEQKVFVKIIVKN